MKTLYERDVFDLRGAVQQEIRDQVDRDIRLSTSTDPDVQWLWNELQSMSDHTLMLREELKKERKKKKRWKRKYLELRRQNEQSE